VPGAIRIFIPGSAANPQRTGGGNTIKPEVIGGASVNAGKGTPDLAKLSSAGVLQVAEIKPANINQVLEGETQVARYIDQGNARDQPQEAWRLANKITVVSPMLEQTFTPPSLFFPQPGFIIEAAFSWCQSGVLAYALRARRVPEGSRVRVPQRVPQTNKEKDQVPDSGRRPVVLDGPATTPVPTPAQPPVPGQKEGEGEGGKVIPIRPPATAPAPQQLPIAARSAAEQILDFIASVLASGKNIDQAVTQFLKAHPEIVRNIELAVGAIAAGAIISDVLSFGTAIAKDPVVLAILATMLRIAQTVEN
jgi:hypothetical protein